jgi:hypothetical protein
MKAYEFLPISALLVEHRADVRSISIPISTKTQENFTEHAMNSINAADTRLPREDKSLAGRYGKIGIPAVAAAVRYQSEAKNPAYAPVTPRADQWLDDVAA